MTTPQTPPPAPGDNTEGDLIVIVDDHELFATSLRLTLGQHGFSASQAPITSHDDVVEYVRGLRPSLVVLDLHLGHDGGGRRICGVELVRPLARLGCAVLVVSGSRDQPREAAAVAAGAVGLVPKTASFITLLEAVRTVREGGSVMPVHLRQEWLRYHAAHQTRLREHTKLMGRLSTREREVLDLLVQGLRAGAVAEHFVVSMTTVRTQIRAILSKLGVSSQLEAVALATKYNQDSDRFT